jgi:hypothetical protein
LCFLYWVRGRKQKKTGNKIFFIFESLGFHSGVAEVPVLLVNEAAKLSIFIRCSDAMSLLEDREISLVLLENNL